MATSKIFTLMFVVVVSSSTVFAQESTEASSSGGSQDTPTTQVSFGSGIFDHFPFKPPSFDLHALWPHFAASGLVPRHKRSIEGDSEIEDHPRAKRSVITCNFLAQGGFRCTSCKNVRRCYPFNMGTLTTCGGNFPYCNNGVCSSVKGSLCSSTTSTSSSTTTSTTTPASTTRANNSTDSG